MVLQLSPKGLLGKWWVCQKPAPVMQVSPIFPPAGERELLNWLQISEYFMNEDLGAGGKKSVSFQVE